MAQEVGLCLKTGFLFLDKKDLPHSDFSVIPAGNETAQVKENYLSPISIEPALTSEVEQPTKPAETPVIPTPFTPMESVEDHLPLKELVNGPVASTTRSRFRISSPVLGVTGRVRKLRASNANLNMTENLFRQPRKRR